MDRDQIIALMKAYFTDQLGPEAVEGFETLHASDLIEDSVDAVTFVMYLEEKTGQDIPMAEVGPALTGLTFQELAAELGRLLTPLNVPGVPPGTAPAAG